jgi:hypothetical protein
MRDSGARQPHRAIGGMRANDSVPDDARPRNRADLIRSLRRQFRPFLGRRSDLCCDRNCDRSAFARHGRGRRHGPSRTSPSVRSREARSASRDQPSISRDPIHVLAQPTFALARPGPRSRVTNFRSRAARSAFSPIPPLFSRSHAPSSSALFPVIRTLRRPFSPCRFPSSLGPTRLFPPRRERRSWYLRSPPWPSVQAIPSSTS